MKWLVCCVAFCLLRHGEGGALKCIPNSQDRSCSTDLVEKDTSIQTSKDDSSLSEKSLEIECASGSEWESHCHSCKCTQSGRTVCQKKESCDSKILGEPLRCKPHSSFLRGCSTCLCTETGQALCPPCDSTKPSSNCVPNTLWKNDCNTCRCLPDGKSVCTRMECVNFNNLEAQTVKREESSIPATLNELDLKRNFITLKSRILSKRSLCIPNREFQSDCNTCKCSSTGGSYRCTQNECLGDDKFKEVEVFSEGPGVDHVERHSVCKPWDVFKISCNTCRCNYDGTDYTCSDEPCPLPQDVELIQELKADNTPVVLPIKDGTGNGYKNKKEN